MQQHQAFNLQLETAYAKQEIPYSNLNQIVVDDGKYPFPAINLTSAIHHVCGGMSITFESNTGMDAPPQKFTPDEILDSHLILFEEAFKFMEKSKLK
ncbi:hypothetical protein D3C87_1886020 [compost metagenome]